MCVAIVKPAGVEIPSDSDLQKCYQKNPHGAGFMVTSNSGKTVMIYKGFFSFGAFLKAMKARVTKGKSAVIHFRIATHGTVTGGLCHPFPISESFEEMRKTEQICHGPALAHNGVLPCGNGGDSTVSDTMTFAKILAETRIHEGAKKDNGFSRSILMMTKGSKVVIMWPNGTTRLFGEWKKVDGVFYSNMYWQDLQELDFGTDDTTEESRTILPSKGSSKIQARIAAPPSQGRQINQYVTYVSAADKEKAKETKRCPRCNDRLIRGTDGSFGCTRCQFTS